MDTKVMKWHFVDDYGDYSWTLHNEEGKTQGMILLKATERGHYYSWSAFHLTPPYGTNGRSDTLQNAKGLVEHSLEKRKT